jgi:hypothetical protein
MSLGRFARLDRVVSGARGITPRAHTCPLSIAKCGDSAHQLPASPAGSIFLISKIHNLLAFLWVG